MIPAPSACHQQLLQAMTSPLHCFKHVMRVFTRFGIRVPHASTTPQLFSSFALLQSSQCCENRAQSMVLHDPKRVKLLLLYCFGMFWRDPSYTTPFWSDFLKALLRWKKH
ncbi:hypothetical protein AtNW77_Chr4g0289031 [Arabidopsis thaliana]